MRQWAITVGINQYRCFQPLSYAQQDAQAVHTFLVQTIGLPPAQCLLLTDTSPPIAEQSTYPTRHNLQTWLEVLLHHRLQPADRLWIFFSGYGVCQDGQDYWMPIDGDPATVSASGIAMTSLFQQLKAIGVEHPLLLLDMSRSQAVLSQAVVGQHTSTLAQATGIPTLLSCQPGQFSRDAAALGQGFFTVALLESLRSRPDATLTELEQHLSDRLTELSEHYWRPLQQPYLVCPDDRLTQPVLGHLDLESPEAKDSTAETATHQADPGLVTAAVKDQATIAVPLMDNLPPAHRGDSRTSPSPAVPAAEAPVEGLFWRSMQLWGGIVAATLLTAVLARNWSALTQSASIGVPPVSPSAAQPSPSAATPTAIPTTQPAPASNLSPAPVSQPTRTPIAESPLLTARSQIAALPNQAFVYHNAIQLASAIQPNQPQYSEARQAIAQWSSSILTISRQHAQRQDFVSAIRAAAWVPPEQPVSGQAQQAIAQWCPALKGKPAETKDQLLARQVCLNQKK